MSTGALRVYCRLLIVRRPDGTAKKDGGILYLYSNVGNKFNEY